MKPTVAIATPHNRDLTPEYVLSLFSLINFSKEFVDIQLYMFEGCMIHESRNELALKTDTDYLFFIDSDTKFPEDGLMKLLAHNKDIIGGLYYGRQFPHQPIVYRKKAFLYEHIDQPQIELFECDAIGTGFLLIKREVIDKLSDKYQRPFNLIDSGDKTGIQLGEDISFCNRAKIEGYKIWCDPNIGLRHIGIDLFGARHYKAFLDLERIKRQSIEYSNDIEGWIDDFELDWLYKTAKTMDSIVEIGSWKGKSTHALLSACKGKVHAVDHWQGSKGEELEHAEAKIEDIYNVFMNNVGQFGNLVVIKSDSVEAANQFEDKSIDMIFIDGGHSYEQVKADIEAWLPKCKKLICGHDYNWLGVRKAVKEKLGKVDTAVNIWIKEIN